MSLEYDNLLGRPFYSVGDCLNLFRDFYAQNFDIHIARYACPHDWSSDKVDLIRKCYEREGFDMITDWKVKDLRPGDVLCVAVGEANPNHFVIFLGDDLILHHLYGRFSAVGPMRDFWRNQTCFILRHPAVPDLRPVYPDVDIGTLIDARNNPSPE